MLSALLLIVVGLFLTAWGLPASHRLTSVPAAFAALAIPAGVILFLLGTLLLAVPGFFRG